MDASGANIEHELSLLFKSWPQIIAVKYLTAAGLSILIYDLILNIPSELALIWRPWRFSFPKGAYVLNRYGAIVLLALFLLGALTPPRLASPRKLTFKPVADPPHALSSGFCARTTVAIALSMFCVDAIGHGLTLFRIFLLWNRNPRILRLMLSGASVAYAVNLTFAILFVKELPKEASYIDFPLHICIVSTQPKLLMGVFIPEILIDVYGVSLVFYNAMDRPRVAGQKIYDILQHDGLFLLLSTFCLRALLLSLSFTSNTFLATIGISFVEAIITTVNARLFLMLYTAAQAPETRCIRTEPLRGPNDYNLDDFDEIRSLYSLATNETDATSRHFSSKSAMTPKPSLGAIQPAAGVGRLYIPVKGKIVRR